jgi:aminopeptidase-like protein
MNLSEIFDELFPICRSIAGPGIRESMQCLSRHVPFQIIGVPSGTKVFDWTVPQEWELIEASLKGPNGREILSSRNNNLHVLNFSGPIDLRLSLEDLQKNLHSLPSYPSVIPYLTSYYTNEWGFCLTDEQRKTLQPGEYHAQINARKFDGELNYAVTELPGKTDKLVLITSYLCHPSLANNELSGPLCLLSLYEKIASWANRQYTYRFLLIPETIGSIVYLSLLGRELKAHLFAGIVLTCLGGPVLSLSVKKSRRSFLGDPANVDLLADHLQQTQSKLWRLRDFDPTSGSDERQFCSPGFNLPFVQIARTIYGEYAEYHTSGDTKEFMRIDQVERSVHQIERFIKALDYEGLRLRNTSPFGEPQLGRRGMYPNMNSPNTWGYSSDRHYDERKILNMMLNLLSLADGERSLRDVASLIKSPVTELCPVADRLEAEGLVERIVP